MPEACVVYLLQLTDKLGFNPTEIVRLLTGNKYIQLLFKAVGELYGLA